MWLCLFLWYALVYIETSHGRDITEFSKYSVLPRLPRFLNRERPEIVNNRANNIVVTGLSSVEQEYQQFPYFRRSRGIPFAPPSKSPNVKSRSGYEKDLMLVLPVMPENREANDSDLQMWYTQMPVTAIIEDDPKPRITSKSDYVDVSEDPTTTKSNDDTRHPYTNFLVNKPVSKPQTKTPLDYGYPESFKFVEDLNEVPKNHKPEWASTDIAESTRVRTSTEAMTTTRHSPFDMFESVKPLEINKLLSVQPVQILVSDTEEPPTTKPSYSTFTSTKRPYAKRPTKKPPKPKYTTTMQSVVTESETTTTPSLATPGGSLSDADQIYAAVRYTALFSETGKGYFSHLNATKLKSTNSSISTEKTMTTTTTEPSTTESTRGYTTASTTPRVYTTSSTTPRVYTTTSTTPRVYTTSTSPPARTTITTTSTPITTTFLNEFTIKNNLANEIMKIAGFMNTSAITDPTSTSTEFFEPPLENLDSFQEDFPISSTVPPPLSGDMLTNEMKSMLIALGILNAENAAAADSLTTTTERQYFKKEPVTPNIDAESYSSFKKIPIDTKEEPEQSSISDDMKDLLASFGLLSKEPSETDNSITRTSRQQNLNKTEDIPVGDKTESEVLDFFNEDETANGTIPNTTEASFEDINSEMLSSDMKNTLSNLGLLKPLPSLSFNTQPIRNGHVFQPTSHLEKLNKEQKVEKINDVIRTIKQLSKDTDANNLSVEEIEKQLENITATLDENFTEVNETLLTELSEIFSNDTQVKIIKSVETIQNETDLNTSKSSNNNIHVIPPITTAAGELSANKTDPINQLSPLSSEELQLLYDSNKNEAKRQQPEETSTVFSSSNSSSETASTTEEFPAASTIVENLTTFESSTVSDLFVSSTSINATVAPSSSTTVSDTKTAENNNAPIADLAESFGGGGVASEEPSIDDLPTPKPNGLYFYLDWNTFLNVGEEDKNPIRIRFSPRAGNARNFLPIQVP